MYAELILRPQRLAEQVIYPDQARKLVAAAVGAYAPQGDPRAAAFQRFFGRDEQGKTLQGRIGDDREGQGFGRAPEIVFDGGRGFLRVYGIGAAGAELLLTLSTDLYRAISAAHGVAQQQLNQGTCEIDRNVKGQMVPHRIRLMVASKRPGDRLGGLESDRTLSLLRRHIAGGLISQSELLGRAMQIPRDEEIEILEGRSYPVPIREGVIASGLKDVVFAMPCRLKGPWLAGHLRSRGYGFMRPVAPTSRASEGA